MTHSKWQIGLLSLVIIMFTNLLCSGMQKDLSETDHVKFKDVDRNTFLMAEINYGNVWSPIGSITLIKNGNDVCAVRFTETHRGHDKKSPTMFNSGEENEYAEYDWYYQGDGSGDFSKSNVKSGHAKLRSGPMVGFNRISIQTGTTVIKCGPFKLGWIYPFGIGFNTTYRKEGDVGNELAPSKWQEVKEIDIHASRLIWYRFDENRKKIIIPLNEL